MAQKRSSQALKKAARQVLLLCTTADISPKNKKQLSRILADGIDWEYLLNLAEFHSIIPLVAHNLVNDDFRGFIPEAYLNRLNRVYNSTLYRNVLLSNELANVLSAFSKHGLAVIPLKGTVLAEVLYQNPALRTSADMDILARPKDVSQAKEVLSESGYQQATMPATWEHHFHEAPYYKQASIPFFLELHWDLEDKKLATVPEEEIWHRARPLQLQGISTMVLSPEDNLLFLATHIWKHNDELLKFLGDIAELLKKYQDTLDWDYIVTSARSWQTDVAVYYALRWAKYLLKVPVPVSVIKTLKPSYWRRSILGLLINKENFIAPIRTHWLRLWASVLARGLMMKHPRQTLIVLSRQQDPYKKWAWLRTTSWVGLVLIAAFWRNGARAIFR